MVTILATMTASERTNLLRIQFKGESILWTEKMDTLIALCQTKKVRRGPSSHPFPELSKVLAFLKDPQVK